MQTFIIIVIGSAGLWLAYRLVVLCRGIEDLTAALKDESIFERESLPETTQQDRLSRLSAAVLNTATEGEMMRMSEMGRRKILDYLLNQIEDALFVVDEHYEVRFVNKAALRLFPAAQGQIGRPLIEICRDHHIDETVRLAVSANGKMQDQIKLVNSSETLLIEAGPIDPDYKIGSGAWLIIRDITERLQTEQIRKDFVANASHELRTPLSILNGYLEILDEDGDDSTISVMKKHTDRLTRIVEDMLTISKLESNQADESLLRMELFDISECINGTIERLQLLIDRHDTVISVKYPKEGLRGFYGDPYYWDQVFFNLVENALKQNARLGLKITVRVKRLEVNDRFEIDVIDNGVGIPAADLEGVFKRFYKVDKQHASGELKGTGLGLSIVKRAIEAHHGSISVTSQPGRKTCFHLSVPPPPLSVLSPV